MLVTYEDYCLIGRGVNFPENRYSCLAGYVESGETLEDASRRELYEEAGVIGLDVNYVLSQPWPFPSTLMVGMHVIAQAQELTLDYNELSDAKWVHKNDIKSILEGDESFGFSVPSKIAIARNLLELWVSSKI
jgi:NAD+ diphosphatase